LHALLAGGVEVVNARAAVALVITAVAINLVVFVAAVESIVARAIQTARGVALDIVDAWPSIDVIAAGLCVYRIVTS
jgi:hypothetical protein